MTGQHSGPRFFAKVDARPRMWICWMREDKWERKPILGRRRKRFTSCGVRAKVACGWTSSSSLLPWQWRRRYRDGINKEPHQYHGRLINQGACFSTVILWWTINVAERPFKESHRARRRPDELPLLPLFGENTDSPYFFPYGPGLEIVKLSFQQSSSLLFSFIFFFVVLAALAIAKLYQHILEVWRACCMAQGCLCADRDMMIF